MFKVTYHNCFRKDCLKLVYDSRFLSIYRQKHFRAEVINTKFVLMQWETLKWAQWLAVSKLRLCVREHETPYNVKWWLSSCEVSVPCRRNVYTIIKFRNFYQWSQINKLNVPVTSLQNNYHTNRLTLTAVTDKLFQSGLFTTNTFKDVNYVKKKVLLGNCNKKD